MSVIGLQKMREGSSYSVKIWLTLNPWVRCITQGLDFISTRSTAPVGLCSAVTARLKRSVGDCSAQVLDHNPLRPVVLGQGFSRSVDPLPKGSYPTTIRQKLQTPKQECSHLTYYSL